MAHAHARRESVAILVLLSMTDSREVVVACVGGGGVALVTVNLGVHVPLHVPVGATLPGVWEQDDLDQE